MTKIVCHDSPGNGDDEHGVRATAARVAIGGLCRPVLLALVEDFVDLRKIGEIERMLETVRVRQVIKVSERQIRKVMRILVCECLWNN